MEHKHFFSFDDRFCGVKGMHQVTPNDDDVTCPECLKNKDLSEGHLDKTFRPDTI